MSSDMIDRINALADNIDTMPDEHRDAILDALLAKRAEREKNAGRPKLKTPAQVAADPRNKSLLYEVAMRCRRAGYDIEGDEYVDLRKLDKALDERGMRAEGWSIKTNLARLGLVY
jgi:hypothetical protein